jgi:urea transporter
MSPVACHLTRSQVLHFFRRSTRTAALRTFATSSGPPEDLHREKDDNTLLSAFRPLADMSARGIGQVIFLNSPTSGAVVLSGLAIGSPYLASLAALGAVTATATAKAAQLDKGTLQAGLWGYNGCLVGCAAAVFGPASILAATTSTLIGAAASPLVSASLKETMSIPQWTYAFNIVALTSLLRTRPFLVAPPEEAAEAVTTTAITNTSTTGFGDLVLAPLVGISQIFVVESALSGAVIIYGIGMYSPGLAAHAVAGSAVGSLVGVCSGADLQELAMGLWGFNSALTSMAVGVFFVHSAPTMALSAGGAAVTATVFGAMKTIFGAYGAPCLTLPFCTTMSACYLLHKQISTLQLAKDPHSPEKNSA